MGGAGSGTGARDGLALGGGFGFGSGTVAGALGDRDGRKRVCLGAVPQAGGMQGLVWPGPGLGTLGTGMRLLGGMCATHYDETMMYCDSTVSWVV